MSRLIRESMFAASRALKNSDVCFVWDGAIEDALAHLRTHGVTVEQGPVTRHGAQPAMASRTEIDALLSAKV